MTGPQPDRLITWRGTVTEADWAELTRRWRKLHDSKRYRMKLMTPLPLRTRIRLRAERAVNSLGFWLVDHKMIRAARWLWRI